MNRMIQVILVCSLLLISGIAFADLTNEHTQKADALKAIGLFSGSSKGYELNRAPNRIEAAVMLVRLLGKETEVKASVYTHPFTDVPAWANNYVGYMYTNQLSKGISETEFGADKLVDAKSYATFVLRALGYNDAAGDFAWATALDFAAEKGILTQGEKKSVVSQPFLRDELVQLSYGTLKASIKDTTKPLIDELIENKVVEPFAAVTNGIAQIATYRDSLSGKVSYSGVMKDIDTSLSGVSLHLEVNGEYVAYGTESNGNPGCEIVRLSVPNSVIPNQNILARVIYFYKGKMLNTVYLEPATMSVGATISTFYGYKIKSTYDEIQYELFEPNAFDVYTLIGKAPILKIPVSKIKTAIDLMKKAAYVQNKFASNTGTLVTTEASLFVAATRYVDFLTTGNNFYMDNTAVYRNVPLVNQYKLDGKMVGKPPVITDMSSSGLTALNPHLDVNSKLNGEYDLDINHKEPTYFILRDANFQITSVILITK